MVSTTLPESGLRRRHVVAVTLGNALEFYDFLTYSFFAIQIGHAFFPSHNMYASLMGSLATFGAGFLMRPVGAIVIGRYADEIGRRPAMLLSFLLMGASIFLMASIPPYSMIGVAAPILAVLARMAQGFALGGEIGSNTAFLIEAASPETRGAIVSWQGASQFIAAVCGSVMGAILSMALTSAAFDSYGWRIAFALGALTVPFGLWLRTNLPETLHGGRASSPAPQSMLLLASKHWKVMTLGLVVLGMGTIGSYIQLYTVTYAQEALHLSQRAGFIAQIANLVTAIPAMLAGGWLSDRIGRWPVNFWGNLTFLVVIYPCFAFVVAQPSTLSLVLGMSLLGVAANFMFGSFTATLGESLPRSIRSSGFGTVYSLAIAVCGGSTQFIVTWLIHVTENAMAPAWLLLGATMVAQVAYLLFPETAPVRVGNMELELDMT